MQAPRAIGPRRDLSDRVTRAALGAGTLRMASGEGGLRADWRRDRLGEVHGARSDRLGHQGPTQSARRRSPVAPGPRDRSMATGRDPLLLGASLVGAWRDSTAAHRTASCATCTNRWATGGCETSNTRGWTPALRFRSTRRPCETVAPVDTHAKFAEPEEPSPEELPEVLGGLLHTHDAARVLGAPPG